MVSGFPATSSVHPSTSQVDAQALLTPHHSVALDLWRLQDPTMSHGVDPVLGRAWRGMAVVTVGTYSSSASEVAQISDDGWSTTTHLPIRAESPHWPRLPCSVAPQQGRGGRGWGQ